MRAMDRYLWEINKKSCNLKILDEKGFSGESALSLELTECRYANLARLATKAIFFK